MERFNIIKGFPGGSASKESAHNVGDLDSIHETGKRNDNPLQYSCLENPMDRGAWQSTVHEVTKNWTQLSESHTHTHTHTPTQHGDTLNLAINECDIVSLF